MSKIVVGIDLGGTNVKTAAVSQDKKILTQDSRPTAAENGPEAVMDVMAQAVKDVVRDAGLSLEDVTAVGIGAPGPMNWQTGIVYSPPNLPGWRNVPLAESMFKRLNVPCYVDNDANVACFGEYWSGAGQGVDTMCLLTLGTGVGGGIVINGELLRGIDGTAAEIGHLKVMRGGRMCGCGSEGCLEAYASVTGQVRTAKEGIASGQETLLTELSGGDFDNLTGKMITEAENQGDSFARWVTRETGTWLGIGAASLINLLNPERIVFSGGMIASGESLFSAIRETARANAFEVPGKRCEILPAGLGADAGVMGSAASALARHTGEL